MKLVRYGPSGAEKPGLVDAAGLVRDLSGRIRDIDGEALSPESLEQLGAVDPQILPIVEGDVRFGSPVTGTRQFIAVGLNYADHAAEANMPLPAEPVLFTKAIGCINGPNNDVDGHSAQPRWTGKPSWRSCLKPRLLCRRGSGTRSRRGLSHLRRPL